MQRADQAKKLPKTTGRGSNIINQIQSGTFCAAALAGKVISLINKVTLFYDSVIYSFYCK